MFVTKKLIRFVPLRMYSAGAKYINVSVSDDTNFATVTLQRPPVNSLSLELLNEFNTLLDRLEQNQIRGMILTSSLPTVFCGGVDIHEFHNANADRFRKFYTELQSTWFKLYGSSFPTVAAISGHSPAGGCFLATCCEYRVMLPNYIIGANEVQLGLLLMPWFTSMMEKTVGVRQTELATTTGKLYTSEEALKIGLIDEIADDRVTLFRKSEEFLKRFDRVPPLNRTLAKMAMRGKDIEYLQKNMEEDREAYLKYIMQPKVQSSIDAYLKKLKNKL